MTKEQILNEAMRARHIEIDKIPVVKAAKDAYESSAPLERSEHYQFYNRLFHGFVPPEERAMWERYSGLKAIMPE